MQETAETVEHKHFSKFSDAKLKAYIQTGFNNTANHVAALEVLHERQQARENLLHAELLAEIRKPHWSVTPTFWVGLIAMLAACVAAYPVLVPQPQIQQSIAVVTPLVQSDQPAVNKQSSVLPKLPSSATDKIGTVKK